MENKNNNYKRLKHKLFKENGKTYLKTLTDEEMDVNYLLNKINEENKNLRIRFNEFKIINHNLISSKIGLKHFNSRFLDKEEKVLIKPLMVGICRTDVNVAFNKKGFEDKDNLTIGHEMVGVLIDGVHNNKIVTINPSLPNNDFIGLNLDGCITEGYFSIKKEQVYETGFLLDEINDEILKSLAYFEPLCAAFAIIKPLEDYLNITFSKFNNKNYLNILITGKNRIAELVKIIIENKLKTSFKLNLINLSKEETLNLTKNEVKRLDFDFIIETELDQEMFNFFLSNIKNKTTFILKSRSLNNITFNINEIVVKEVNFISAKYGDFYKTLKWILEKENNSLYSHLLGKVFKINQWEEAFKLSEMSSSGKNFIKL